MPRFSQVMAASVRREVASETRPIARRFVFQNRQPVVRKPEAMALIEISMSGNIASAEA
jgi:hypothetical protein